MKRKLMVAGLVMMAVLVGVQTLSASSDGVDQSSQAVATPVPARVLVVNLSGVDVDVQLGDEAAFSLAALASGTPSSLFELKDTSARKLYFKASNDGNWRYFQGLDGKALDLVMAAGNLTVIRFSRNGVVDIVDMPLVGNPDPIAEKASSFCFFMNGSAVQLDAVSLVDTSSTVIAAVKTIPSQAFSTVVAINPGVYGASWERGASHGQTLALGDHGQALLGLTRMSAGAVYLVLGLGEENASKTLKIWQVSATGKL